MHVPVCVLVEVSAFESENATSDSKAISAYARRTALDALEVYQHHVYDYMSYDDAGGFTDRYPSELLGRDDPAKFQELFEHFRLCPLDVAIHRLNEASSKGHFPNVINESMLSSAFAAVEFSPDDCYFNDISIALSLVVGHFQFESRFFSDPDNSTKVRPETLAAVRSQPENFALVFIDLHN